MGPSSERKIIQSLQGWRAIMIIMIFILHVCPDKIPLLAGGNETISFFIILSGFVFGMSNFSYDFSINGVIQFVGKRIKKFYPLHMLMLILCVLLEILTFFVIHDFSKSLTLISKFLVDSVFMQAFIPKETWYFSLNGVSWYLSATVFFYIIFIPVYHKLQNFRQTTLKKIIFGEIILYIVIIMLLQNHDNFTFWTYIFPLFRSIEFVSGIILGIFFSRNQSAKKNINKSLASLIELTILILFIIERILCKYTSLYDFPHNYKSIVGFLIAIGIVYVFSYQSGLFSKLISNKILLYIGNISFEIYIVHQTVMKYCDLFIYKFGGASLRIIMIIILTLFLAIMFHSYGYYNKKEMRGR